MDQPRVQLDQAEADSTLSVLSRHRSAWFEFHMPHRGAEAHRFWFTPGPPSPGSPTASDYQHKLTTSGVGFTTVPSSSPEFLAPACMRPEAIHRRHRSNFKRRVLPEVRFQRARQPSGAIRLERLTRGDLAGNQTWGSGHSNDCRKRKTPNELRAA